MEAAISADAETLYDQANTLLNGGRAGEAIPVYQRAIRLNPDLAEAHCNLGVALRSTGQVRQAIAASARSLSLRPDQPHVCCNLGVALAADGRIEEAMLFYRKAIELAPDFANAHYNLANALRDCGQLEQAIAAYRRAVELKPDFAQAYSNMGMAMKCRSDIQDAIDAYSKAIDLNPDWAEPHWNRSLAYLLIGDFERGWAEFDWRNRLDPPSSRPFPGPCWRGEDLTGKTILLHHEMGLGDTIQFVRYVPLLAGRGASVILECPSELYELLRSIPGAWQVVTAGQSMPAFDAHCPLMGVPSILNTRIDTIPGTVPYLQPDPVRVAAWAERLGCESKGRRVGLVWAGLPDHQYDRDRSIAPSLLSPLACIEGITFISLQKKGSGLRGQGSVPSDFILPPSSFPILDWTSDLSDFSDTAALIANLDLVIAVDTSVAHLAGALGKEVWLLLAFVPDWRWMLNRSDTPWYPFMRLFRQERLGDWTGTIERISRELARFAKLQPPEPQLIVSDETQ